jgi:hypothetical protein
LARPDQDVSFILSLAGSNGAGSGVTSTVSPFVRSSRSHHQTVGQNPKQSINATEARAPGSATFQQGKSDGAARSLPVTARCGAGVRIGRGIAALSGFVIDAGYLQKFNTTNEIVRIKF